MSDSGKKCWRNSLGIKEIKEKRVGNNKNLRVVFGIENFGWDF